MDRHRAEKIGTFILGGVVGAVTGILIAPRSGRELRGAVSSRAGEARERGREGYFEARERARERLAGMQEPRPAKEDAVEMPLGETFPDEAVPAGSAPEEPEEPAPGLRAVPRQEDREEPGDSGETGESGAAPGEREDPEALRRRVRQTRERLRSRRSGDSGEDAGG